MAARVERFIVSGIAPHGMYRQTIIWATERNDVTAVFQEKREWATSCHCAQHNCTAVHTSQIGDHQCDRRHYISENFTTNHAELSILLLRS